MIDIDTEAASNPGNGFIRSDKAVKVDSKIQ
jgi:hypothetical protein